jgi:hypothetical protein
MPINRAVSGHVTYQDFGKREGVNFLLAHESNEEKRPKHHEKSALMFVPEPVHP